MQASVSVVLLTLFIVSAFCVLPNDQSFWKGLAQRELHEALKLQWNLNTAKNVIIFIGDGMGPNTVTATRIYKGGESHRLVYEEFPHMGMLKISRIVALVYYSIRLSATNMLLSQDNIENRDLAFHKMITIITVMILVFECLMCFALVVGLHKRLDQHLEMFYVGSFAFLVMRLVVFAVNLFRYANILESVAWVALGVEIVAEIIVIYFLLVIRSYYYKMKAESDREQLAIKDNFYARTKPIGFAYSNKA